MKESSPASVAIVVSNLSCSPFYPLPAGPCARPVADLSSDPYRGAAGPVLPSRFKDEEARASWRPHWGLTSQMLSQSMKMVILGGPGARYQELVGPGVSRTAPARGAASLSSCRLWPSVTSSVFLK